MKKPKRRPTRAAAQRASDAVHDEAHDQETWDKASAVEGTRKTKKAVPRSTPTAAPKSQGRSSGKAPAKSQSRTASKAKSAGKPSARAKKDPPVDAYFTPSKDVTAIRASAHGENADVDEDKIVENPAPSKARSRGRQQRRCEAAPATDISAVGHVEDVDEEPRGKENDHQPHAPLQRGYDEDIGTGDDVLAPTEEPAVMQDKTNIFVRAGSAPIKKSVRKAPAVEKNASLPPAHASPAKPSGARQMMDIDEHTPRPDADHDLEELPDALAEEDADVVSPGVTEAAVAEDMDVSPARASALPKNPRESSKKINIVPPGSGVPTPMEIEDEDLPDASRLSPGDQALVSKKAEHPEICNAFTVVLREIRSIREVVDTMHVRLDSVEGVFGGVRVASTTVKRARSTGSKNGSQKADPGLMELYASVMDKHAPNIKSFFPDKAWAHAILFAAIDDMWTYSLHETFTVEDVYFGLSSILFSLANNEDGKSKEAYRGNVGTRASLYRKKVLGELLRLARAGTYAPVVPGKDSAEKTMPFWLGPRGTGMYITEEHMSAAAKQFETKSSNTPEYNRRLSIGGGVQPTSDDIAEYVMATLYKLMSERFRLGRRRVAEIFCDMIGYLFVSWASIEQVPVSDDHVILRWFKARAERAILQFADVDVACTEDTAKFSADEMNKKFFANMFNRRELRLWVCHDILMAAASESKSEGVRHSRGKDFRRFRREMSLVSPVAELFMTWAGFKDDMDPHELLRFHRQSLRVMYGVSVVMRDVIDFVVARQVGDGITCKTAANVQHSAEDQDMLRRIWKLLLPGKTMMERAVVSSTCAVTERFYEDNRYKSEREKKGLKDKQGEALAHKSGRSRKQASKDDRSEQAGSCPSSHSRDIMTEAGARKEVVTSKPVRRGMARREESGDEYDEDEDTSARDKDVHANSRRAVELEEEEDETESPPADSDHPAAPGREERKCLQQRVLDEVVEDEEEEQTACPTQGLSDADKSDSDDYAEQAPADKHEEGWVKGNPRQSVREQVASRVASLCVDETDEDDSVVIPGTPPPTTPVRANRKVDRASLILPARK